MQDANAKPETTAAFPGKRARMIRPGAIGITISATEYVMPLSEANELMCMINSARHAAIEAEREADDDRIDRRTAAEKRFMEGV